MLTSSRSLILACAAAGVFVGSTTLSQAATYVWNNTAAPLGPTPPQSGDTWGLGSNWSIGGTPQAVAPGAADIAQLPAYPTINGSGPQINAAYSIGGIIVDNTQADYTLGFGGGSGISLTLGSSGINASGGGTFTLQPSFALSADQTWTIASGTTVKFDRQVLASSGNLIVDGGGLLLGANQNGARTGTTTINGGSTIRTGFGNAFGTGNVTVNSGTLELNVGSTITGWNLQLNDGARLRGMGSGVNAGQYNKSAGFGAIPNGAKIALGTGTTAGDTLVLGGNAVVTGGDASSLITAEGPGTVVINSGGGNYNGAWKLTSGALRLINTNSLGNGTRPVEVTGGRLELQGSPNTGPVTFSLNANVTGNATLELDRSGTNAGTFARVLSNATFAGVDVAIRPGNNSSSMSGASTFSITSLVLSGSPVISIDRSTDPLKNYALDVTLASIAGGTNGFTKAGVGKLILSGANTYSGPTAVTGGVLQVNNTGGLGTTSALNIASGAETHLNNTTTWNLNASQFGGDGTLRVGGAGASVVNLNGVDVTPGDGTAAGVLNVIGAGNAVAAGGTDFPSLTIRVTGAGEAAGIDYSQLAFSGAFTGLSNVDLIIDVADGLTLADLENDVLTVLTASTNFQAGSAAFRSVSFSGNWTGTVGYTLSGTGMTVSNLVPEPASLAVLAMGAAGLLRRRRA